MLRLIVSELLFVILIHGGISLTYAAPFTLDENLKPHELKLRDLKDHPGILWTGAKGTLETTSHYIVVNGMNVQRQKLAIIIATGDQSVELDVVKNIWDERLQHCEAVAGDSCELDFRTGGDAGFKISGSADATYEFVLLSGPEHAVQETLKSPIYSVSKGKINEMKINAGEKTVNSGEESNTVSFQAIVIVMLAVLIFLVLIGVILMMKKKSTLLSLFLLVFLAGPFLPHSSHADGVFEESKDFGDKAGKVKSKLDVIEKGVKLSKTWLDKCEATGNPPGEPQIPSFCSGNDDCKQCYSDARADFNTVRAKLEKLRVIYACSTKFSKSAIAFGDGSSGVHGVVGLVWQTQKLEIQKSVSGLEKAYDRKYVELISKLHTSMVAMGECEKKFGVEDWYDRFGFIYYEFMSDKYKRAD